MSSIVAEIVILLLLILINGGLALSEIAIVSARKARLQHRANQGQAGARAALALAEEPTRFLSTVQIGITLVGILAGAFGGATLAEQLAARLSRVPWLAQYSEAVAISIVVLVITYLSLVLGELAPKRLALSQPEAIASIIALPMRWLSVGFGPVVRLLSVSTDAVLRVLGPRPTAELPVSEDEIKILIRMGAEAGVFVAAEREIVESVFRLADRRVGALLTPRTEITWLDVTRPLDEIETQVAESSFSRFPVAQDSLDNVRGILRGRDFLAARARGQPATLVELVTPPLYVPESLNALALLDLFKQTGQEVALVIDEYGGLQGMVTSHDILEAIVGDMPAPGEVVEGRVVQREDGSWLLDGLVLTDEFKALLELDNLPDETHVGYQTLGGFVLAQIGDIPSAGQHFDFGGYRFEVVDMDGRRVDKVLVRRHPAPLPRPPGSPIQ